jgi:hypothetical protein
MALNPDSGEEITLAEAEQFTRAFRAEYPTQLKGFFIGINNFQKILDQADCIGIRMYNGYDEVAKQTNLVLIGVDGNEKDMTSGIIIEKAVTCPSVCDMTSSLV